MFLGFTTAGDWELLAAAMALLASALAFGAVIGQRRLMRRVLGVLHEPDIRGALLRVSEGLVPLDRRVAHLERAQDKALEREHLFLGAPGVVRFQAYGGQGPAMSFSVALVNGRHDGIVLTSLYGRDQVRLYAKPLVGGVPALELGAEEQEALALAGASRSGEAPSSADSGRRAR